MTTIISGSSPSITFSDSTTQTTAFTSTPSVTSITTSADATINTVVVGKGGGNDSTSVCVGSSTLPSGNTGTDNNAFGVGTLLANTTGSFGSGFGRAALRFNTSGNYNTAFGANALLYNTTASNNTAVGYQAGYKSTAAYNQLFGTNAGYNITSGGFNVCVGGSSGYYLDSGSGNVIIGGQTGAGGYAPAQSITTQSNYISIGSTSTTNAYIQVAWTVVSDARDKINIVPVAHGLNFVNQLNPVAYQFIDNRIDKNPNGDTRYGFLAQDILALEGDNPVIIDNKDLEHLRYNGESLVPVLVKALQELNAKFDAYVASHP